MSLSQRPLSYCTNVHPGTTVEAVEDGLTQFTQPVQTAFGRPLAAGLWLARSVVSELLADTSRLSGFSDRLRDRQLVCYTLNAFPYGDFHSARVKERVYLPDWTTTDRLEYTDDCARVLAHFIPAGEGSISTVPLGFKHLPHGEDFEHDCRHRLLELVRRWDARHQDSGTLIRLAVEPEPCCVLETTSEALAFFSRLFDDAASAGLLEATQRHIGVCFDVCHQSVEFEDVSDSIRRLTDAGVRINKVHITCAIELVDPAGRPEAREALARYVEPRYLHQTFARLPDGRVVNAVDLTESLTDDPPADFLNAERWRVHFHVPVNARSLGPLSTTHSDLDAALATVAELDYAPDLEVETYTWEVLPPAADGRSESPPLVDGLLGELTATQDRLDTIIAKFPSSDS